MGKALAWFRDVPTLWKGIGAVATTVATILGILPWLFPSISPQPPPSEVWADLADPRAGPQMALAQYIQRPGVPAGARRDAQALGGEAGERVGAVVYFDLSAEGYEGEPIRIVWSLSDADTGEPVAGLTNQKAWPNSLIEPQSRSRRLALETWVPLPRGHQGPFLVSLEAFGGEGEGRLDYEEVTVGPQDGAG